MNRRILVEGLLAWSDVLLVGEIREEQGAF